MGRSKMLGAIRYSSFTIVTWTSHRHVWNNNILINSFYYYAIFKDVLELCEGPSFHGIE
jgi:hypothetical protein